MPESCRYPGFLKIPTIFGEKAVPLTLVELAQHEGSMQHQLMVLLLQLTVDVWIRDGRELNALAVDSGCWTLTREQNHYRPKTLKNYLHLKTLPKRPKWQLVLRTAEYVLGECDTSPLSLELESKTKRFEKRILDIHPTLNETENKRSQNQSGKKNEPQHPLFFNADI